MQKQVFCTEKNNIGNIPVPITCRSLSPWRFEMEGSFRR